MDRIFKELPIVFPFYELKVNQNRHRENVEGLNEFKLISPSNALLPFQIEMATGQPEATKWEIKSACGGNVLDISNNLNKIKIYNFADKKQAVYFGDALVFNYETISQPLNLPAGDYYTVFSFANGSQFVSEVFTVPENGFNVGAANGFIKLEFWNDKDISPVLYRDNFRQTIYLNTFVSSYIPEIDEEVEKDGLLNEIPVFQRLVLRYKIVEVVPDFIKIALISLQMHDNLMMHSSSRTGEIKRVTVSTQPHEGDGLNDIEILFDDEVLYKNACTNQQAASTITNW